MSKNVIFNYIDAVVTEKKKQEDIESFNEGTNVKLSVIAKNTDDCRESVVATILGKLYVNSIPLDSDYIDSHETDLIDDFANFLKEKGGCEYIKEAINRTQSPKLKRIMECASKIANKYEFNKESNVSQISAKDLDYRQDDEDKKDIENTMDSLEFDNIADVIKQNVKQTIQSEIDKAKQCEQIKNDLQAELSEDDDITSEDDIDNAVELDTVGESTFYEPTLLEAMMVKYSTQYLNEGASSDYANDKALNESAKDLTKLTLLNTMNIESFDAFKLDDIKNNYLQ